MQNFSDVKLEVFIPHGYVDQIREELAKIGVGVIGNYDHCLAITQVTGYFRPLEGANPFTGNAGEVSMETEYKLEVNCKRGLIKEALKSIKGAHPYEEPLINIIPLANHLFD